MSSGFTWVRRLGAAVLVTAALVLAGSPVRGREIVYGGSNIVPRLLPTVVNITIRQAVTAPTTASVEASGDVSASPRSITLVGSGFVIDPSGVIATNWHVVNNAYEIMVTFEDNTRVPATVMSAARSVDIALLKVNVDHPLPAARFGNSDKVQIGDPVLAIGNPLGIGMSVTAGIVSALNHDLMETPYDDFIQTDAAINHGNSGGPLFNMKGEVIGINTALYSPTSGSVGLGFAIPSNNASFVIGRLRKYGWVRPGWLGVRVQQLSYEMANAIGWKRPRGSIISDLRADGPAAKAGLKVGDIILKFGSETPPDERALLRAIAVAPIGEDVDVVFWREGHEMTLPVHIAEWPRSVIEARDAPTPPLRPKEAIPPDLGLTLATPDPALRSKYHLPPDQRGVVVTGVGVQTDAAERGIAPGDVILRVGDIDAASPENVLAGIRKAREAKRDFVLVLLENKKGPTWTALRVGS